jgi:hypothetical protein
LLLASEFGELRVGVLEIPRCFIRQTVEPLKSD